MKTTSKLSVCRRLLTLVKPLTGFMGLAIAAGLTGHLCAALLPVFGGCALLALLGFSAPLPLTGLLVCLGVFALLRGVLHYGEQACNHYIAFTLLALIRDRVFQALRRLCPARLDARDKGDLIAVITADVELLEVFYAHTVSPVAIAALMAILMSLFIGSFHAALGLIALAAYAVVGIVIPVAASRRSGTDGVRLRAQAGELSAFVLDSLRGLPEILQYGRGSARLQAMNGMTDALAGQEEGMKRRAGRSAAVTGAVIGGFDLLLLLTAAVLYQRGSIAFDGVVISLIALMSSFGPVIALANLGSTLQNTLAAGARVLDILNETPAVEEITGEPEVGFTAAAVENVGFSYGGEPVLRDVSLSIPCHAVVGITGPSGSGKSTALKLLMRFWAAQQGRVTLSGTDVNRINTQNLREMESLVTQETQLFHDSIKNNIRIARLDATDAEIEAACRKAAVHDFIMTLPRGYDTPVGELGDTLSGGERQRIGLARAFLHNAPLLLLDEPTSNLDSLNEAVILRSVMEGRGDQTVVLVSHRQSTLRVADRVYTMEEGR